MRNKNLWNWYKSIKENTDVSVYHDHHRKGWFFRIGEERHGYRGSLDKGYESRQKALEALKRYLKNHGVIGGGDTFPEPEPPELVTTFQYTPLTSDKICEYRRLRYGGETPGSGTAYYKLFNGFEEEWPVVDITEYTKSQIEKKQDHNFIILELLHLLKYEPVYDENNRCIGMVDFEGDANVS